MKLLLLGATGLVGSQALHRALGNSAFTEVIAPTRTALPARDRLVNPVGSRLDDLIRVVMALKPDAVVCALGTTQAKAGSKEAFRYVHHELPVVFGKAAHAAGVETYAIVTSMAASTESRSFYCRTKGEVERDVQAIGFRSLTICRPNLIDGARNETRTVEHLALTVARGLAPILPKRFRVSPADRIAAALLDAVTAAKPGRHWIYSGDLA